MTGAFPVYLNLDIQSGSETARFLSAPGLRFPAGTAGGLPVRGPPSGPCTTLISQPLPCRSSERCGPLGVSPTLPKQAALGTFDALASPPPRTGGPEQGGTPWKKAVVPPAAASSGSEAGFSVRLRRLCPTRTIRFRCLTWETVEGEPGMGDVPAGVRVVLMTTA